MTIENPEENTKGKLVDPEIEKVIKYIDESLTENEVWLNESFADLKEGIDLLQADIDYLEHMESHNEFVDDMNKMAEEEGFEKSKNEKYSDGQIKKIKQDIENIRWDIKEINDYMTNLTLHVLTMKEIKEKLEELQQEFNKLLTRIDPKRLN